MPLYEYVCDSGHAFMQKKSITEPLVTVCPKCDDPVKVIIQPSTLSFQGAGWSSPTRQ